MKLWLLSQNYYNDYDTYSNFIVRAETERDARLIVSKQAGDEGASVWLESEKSTCEELLSEGVYEIILGSFHAG